jgi:hypothetical protein
MAKSRRKIYKKRKGTKRRYKGGVVVKPGKSILKSGILKHGLVKPVKKVNFNPEIRKRTTVPNSISDDNYSENIIDTTVNYVEPQPKVSPGFNDEFANYNDTAWEQCLIDFNKERNPSLFRSLLKFCSLSTQDPNFELSVPEKQMYDYLSEEIKKQRSTMINRPIMKELLRAMQTVINNKAAREKNCDNFP